MRIELDADRLLIRLSPWERVLGLMGDISLPRRHIGSVRVIDDGVAEAMRAGMKAGLRIPYVRFVARTISLERAFIVRRGVPALAVSVEDGGRLREVVVSTPRASELAASLSAPGTG
jgi:hypothetical protein